MRDDCADYLFGALLLIFDDENLIRDNRLHDVFVVTLFGGDLHSFADFFLVPVEPPVALEQHIGEGVLLLVGFIKRFDRREDILVCLFEAGLVELRDPEFEFLDLTHDARSEVFVLVVSFFHDTVSLSELFSRFGEPPLDCSFRNAQYGGDLLYRVTVKVVQLHGPAQNVAQGINRLADIRVFRAPVRRLEPV